VDPGAKFGLPAAAKTRVAAGRGQGVTLGCHQGPVKTLFEHAATGADIATASGDLIFWPVPQRAGLV